MKRENLIKKFKVSLLKKNNEISLKKTNNNENSLKNSNKKILFLSTMIVILVIIFSYSIISDSQLFTCTKSVQTPYEVQENYKEIVPYSEEECKDVEVPYPDSKCENVEVPFSDNECANIDLKYTVNQKQCFDWGLFSPARVTYTITNLDDIGGNFNFWVGFVLPSGNKDGKQITQFIGPQSSKDFSFSASERISSCTYEIKSLPNKQICNNIIKYKTTQQCQSIVKYKTKEECQQVTRFKELEKTRSILKLRTDVSNTFGNCFN